jgi:cytochrome P450
MSTMERKRATQVTDYNPCDAAVAEDPFVAFSRLRQHDPVHWSGHLNGWVLTRHEDVRNALLLSVDRIKPFLEHQSERARVDFGDLEVIALWSSFNDAPAHTHLRGLMNRAINPRYIAAAEPAIREIVERLVDGVCAQGGMDVIADFAGKLPISVMAWMLGLPSEDIDQLREWSEEVNLFVGAAKGLSDKYQRAARGVADMTVYFRDVVRRRRAAPGDDLVSRLIAADLDGDRMSDDEVIATCVMLTYAGHVTTAHLIGNGMLALLRNPSQLSLVQQDSSLMPAAVEEMFRYDGPIQAMVRIANQDMELRGKFIQRGDRIFPMLNAANRDPERFEDPDTFNVVRDDTRHMVFGYGPHTCIGMPLARLEIPIAFARLLDRCGAIELTGPVTWINSVAFRGPATLPVTCRPARHP